MAGLDARSSEKGAPPLVVTGADRGERTVLTSRGPVRLRLKEPLTGRVPVNADSGAALPYMHRPY